MMLDITHGHPTGIQRDDHVGEPAQATSPLGHQPRLERASPIPRRVQLDIANLAGHRLRSGPVPRIRRAPAGRITPLIPQVITELGLQTALEHRLDELGQEPTLAVQRSNSPASTTSFAIARADTGANPNPVASESGGCSCFPVPLMRMNPSLEAGQLTQTI